MLDKYIRSILVYKHNGDDELYVHSWCSPISGLLVVVHCMFVQVPGFFGGTLRASNGHVDSFCECCEVIIRQRCGSQLHLEDMEHV